MCGFHGFDIGHDSAFLRTSSPTLTSNIDHFDRPGKSGEYRSAVAAQPGAAAGTAAAAAEADGLLQPVQR